MLTVRYQPPKVDGRVLIAAAATVAVTAAGKLLLEASQPLVPLDTGEMRDSGKVTVEGHRATVSYTRTSPDGYNVAARQHEDATLHHPKGGEDHFLSKPLASEGHAMLEAMAEAVRVVL